MPTVKDVKAEEVTKDVEKAYGSWFKGYLKLFSRRALEWFFIYMVGYYDISFGWLLAPLFFLVLRDKRAKEKKVKFDLVRSLANSDERDILQEIQRFSNLPSWVTFPDMERVEWLNKIVRQLWPYAGQYARDLCKESIEPAIRDALKEYKISNFKFEKIILGDTPPRFSGIKVYDDTSRHEIIMDADFVYAGDCKFEVAISKLKAGIKDLQISGRVRVVMKPLVRQIPLVGGLQVFFLNNPEVDFNLIGIADFFDMPGISDILRSIVIDQIAAMMVLPNRYPIQLVEDIDVVELKCPAPAGVIRLHVIEAKNLMKKDFGMLGTGKSDPYCIMKLGAQKFQTKTINNTISPRWDFCCEYLCESHIYVGDVFVEFSVFDCDLITDDDFLLRANLDVQSIYASGEVDMWVPLSDAKSGRLHIKATWLDLSEISGDLEQQLVEIRSLQNLTINPLHSAVLMVWIDSASKLNGIPDPFVRVHVANSKEETTVRCRTNDPIFEEGFNFLVRNPKTQELIVEAMDQKTNQSLGRVELDLNLFILKKGMESIGEEYSLAGSSGGMATIKMNVSLRVLKAASKKELESSVPKKEEISEISPSTPPPNVSQPVAASSEKPPAFKSSLSTEDQSKDVTVATDHIADPKVTDPDEQNVPKSTPSISASPPSTDEENVLRQRAVSGDGTHSLGRIQLTAKYGTRNNLVIVVHKIENLPKEEDGEIPDPYVKMYLLPDRTKESKRKTDVIKDNCNPIYDERFEYSVLPNELTQRTLQVSVINKKGFFQLQRSATMGQVHLDCGILDPNSMTQWYDLSPAIDEDED